MRRTATSAKFMTFIGPSVGPRGRGRFVSVSLWRLGQAQPLVVVGASPVLAESPGAATAFFARAAEKSQLQRDRPAEIQPSSPGLRVHVARPHRPLRRLCRDRAAGQPPIEVPEHVVVRRPRLRAVSSAGPQNGANLLVTDLKKLPITGRHASTSIPFGNSAFTFVVTPRRPLAGAFAQRLPWLIAIVGLLLSVGAAALTARLITGATRPRSSAVSLEQIAEENRRLYAEQRTIAQTLQHAAASRGVAQDPRGGDERAL